MVTIFFSPSVHDENDYAPAPQPRSNITLWTEPNGEQEPSVSMPDSEHLQLQQDQDSEHLQQQLEQVHVDSLNAQDTMQLPEKESDEVSVLLVKSLEYIIKKLHIIDTDLSTFKCPK